jgi:hypothetical protein
MPADALLNATSLQSSPIAAQLDSSYERFRPIVDGYVVPEDVYSAYRAGKQMKVHVRALDWLDEYVARKIGRQ